MSYDNPAENDTSDQELQAVIFLVILMSEENVVSVLTEEFHWWSLTLLLMASTRASLNAARDS